MGIATRTATPDAEGHGSVEPLERGGEPQWDRYVASHPRATPCHLSVWRELTATTLGSRNYYLMAHDARGVPSGVLPLTRLSSRLFGDYLVSVPYLNYGGPLADDAATEQQLLDHAVRLARELGVSHLELREQQPRDGWAVRTDKVAMSRQLPGQADGLWSEIGAKRRSQVRRAWKAGAEAAYGGAELLPEFYQVFARNMRDLGTPVYPVKWFAAILDRFPGHASLAVIRQHSRPVAAGLLLGHGKRVEIPWASSLREANRDGVNMLLYWAVLEKAIEQGFTEFDFGRSTEGSGTWRFKRQWGAEQTPLYWNYWLRDGGEPPRLNPDNPRFRLAVRTWQRMPLWLANLVGPRIVRHLP